MKEDSWKDCFFDDLYSSSKKENECVKEKEKKDKKLSKLVGSELKKLDLKEGNILIVQLTCDPRPGLRQLIQQLTDAVRKFKKKIPIFIVPKEIKIETLNEEEMNRTGWFRREDYRRLVRPV